MIIKSLFITAYLLTAGRLPVSAGIEVYQDHVTDTLKTSVVTAGKSIRTSRADTIVIAGSTGTVESLNRIPGIMTTDLGGHAGLKTVSLRGLGTAHTGIFIDGMRIGNIQSGQTDLGMIGPVDFVVADYAHNALHFNSIRPRFDCGDTFSGKARINVGSFNTLLPYIRLNGKLSESVAISLTGSGTFSRGDYPYIAADGRDGRRGNNDIRQHRAAIDIFGQIRNGQWHIKGYFNHSDRGTPGPTSWISDDRQEEVNSFIQGTCSLKINKSYFITGGVKMSYDGLSYESVYGDSTYGQYEFQLNQSHIFRISDNWKISATAEVIWDKMKSLSYILSDHSRLTATGTGAAGFTADRFDANVSVEYSHADETDIKWEMLSPSADMKLRITEGLNLVGIVRRAFRVPVFNELYYIGYGNPDLKCEKAWMTDIGAEWNLKNGEWKSQIKADMFYNWLTDKITSAPGKIDPAIWLPYNIGKVLSSGIDLFSSISYDGKCKAGFSARYSLLNAIDKTPDSSTYGRQIPFISRHSVVLTADCAYKGWRMCSIWNLRSGRSDGYGQMPDWNTLDVEIGKAINILDDMVLEIDIKAVNIFGEQYEISQDYPMPGRNFMVCAGLGF